MGVLDIGFEIGSHSKSQFNSHILKTAGVSPAIFRKNFLQEKKIGMNRFERSNEPFSDSKSCKSFR